MVRKIKESYSADLKKISATDDFVCNDEFLMYINKVCNFVLEHGVQDKTPSHHLISGLLDLTNTIKANSHITNESKSVVRKIKEDIEIITPRHRETEVYYSYFYPRKGDHSGGFAFPCDEDGNILFDKMPPEMMDSYKWVTEEHPEYYDKPYIRTERSSYMQDAIAKCICGKEIELYDEYMGACECPYCHRWYNMFGQELKNPEKWNDGYDW